MILNSKCSTYSSLSLGFCWAGADFYGCFSFYENLAGGDESSGWLYYQRLGPSRTFVRNLFSHLDVQEEIRPRPTDYVLWKWRVSAWSADRGLGLIIQRLPADSLPKWNCNSDISPAPSQQGRPGRWRQEVVWLTSSIWWDNGRYCFLIESSPDSQ